MLARLKEQNRGSDVPDFPAWLPEVTPAWTWDWPYQQYIQAQLARVTRGEIRRLMLSVPPRHGKSHMVTIRYPVWRLECDPATRVIVCAYNQFLANDFSRKARRLAERRILLDPERKSAEAWETAGGGGMRAVGVGGGITGQGGDLVVIDDPVKSREEAESPAFRDRVYDWYTDDLYTRLEPGAAIILIMTRWHEDDLAGRILASEDGPSWTVVNLPAEAEAGDPLGRAPGEPLCPARFDRRALAERRQVLGSYAYTALYQGHPLPPEGGLFKRHWFREWLAAAPERFDGVIRYWDRAASEGRGDFSAGVLMGRQGGAYTVIDVIRGQWSPKQREQIILTTALIDRDRYPNAAVWLEQEPGSSGIDSVQASIRNLAGFNVHADRVTGEKGVRAMPFAAQAEAGNIHLVRAPWNGAYLDELCSFPNGLHDDQVDASSGAFNLLAGRRQFKVDFV